MTNNIQSDEYCIFTLENIFETHLKKNVTPTEQKPPFQFQDELIS